MSQSYVNSQAGNTMGQDQQQQQQQQQQQGGANQQAGISDNNNNSASSSSGGGDGSSSIGNNNGQQQQTMNMMIGSSGEQMSQMTSLLLEFAFSAFVNKPQDIVEYAAQYFDQLRSQRCSSAGTNQVHQQQQQQQRSDSLAGEGGAAGTKRPSNDSQRSNLSQNSFTNVAGGGGSGAAGHQTTTTTTTTTATTAAVAMAANSDDDFETYDQGPTQLTNHEQAGGGGPPVYKPKTSYNRRKSVFAEAYDPAADQEDDENNRIVHGKTDEQRQRLARAIKSIFLFRSVDPQDMTQILDAMFEVKVSPGDVVIHQGDDGDNFYVVERGKFQIYYTTDDGQRQVRGEYEDNGFFGELALMYNQPRAATVVALSNGSLWAMDRKTFRRIVLKSAFKKRKEYEALFEKVGILSCLNVSILVFNFVFKYDSIITFDNHSPELTIILIIVMWNNNNYRATNGWTCATR